MTDFRLVDENGDPIDTVPVADAATLAAVQSVVSALAAVGLDSAALAALENITATVSGSVSVSNFPATQPVSGTVTAAEKTSLLPYAQRLTADAAITPTTGKRPQLVWCQVLPDPDNSSSNLVTVQMTIDGAVTNVYTVYALGRSAVFTGDVNTPITIDLANSQPVTVNIQYREV